MFFRHFPHFVRQKILVLYLPLRHPLNPGNIACKRFLIDFITYQQQTDRIAIPPPRKIAHQPGLLQSTQTFQYILDHLIYPGVFQQYTVDILEKRMVDIGGENLLVPLKMAHQHPRLFKAVQFNPDAVGGLPEFRLQVTQIGPGGSVQKELHQQF